jgi:hypothetical protein
VLSLFLALAWSIGQPPPSVSASGAPYCEKLAQEHAPTRPAIHFNRTEGPVGTDLSVTASGWHPGAHVTLHVDGREPITGELYVLMPAFAHGVIATDGTITLTPLDAPSFFCVEMNSYTEYRFGGPDTAAYFVLAADDGEVSAPVAFRYLSAPTLSLGGGAQGMTQEMTVGSSVAVTGSGWEPQAALTVTLTSKSFTSQRESSGTPLRATADDQGAFRVLYPIAANWPWHTQSWVQVIGNGPRFGTLDAAADLLVMPAVQPTFQVDRALATPGMSLTVRGEHWYPGDVYTIKYCAAQWQDGGWADGPDCGKAVNPTLGTVTIDAEGQMHQQFRLPSDQPIGVIMVRILELTRGINVSPVAVQVVDHLPTWDDMHPRVAALRTTLVGSLPFTVPAALLLGALAVVGVRRVRRWRARHRGGSISAPRESQ